MEEPDLYFDFGVFDFSWALMVPARQIAQSRSRVDFMGLGLKLSDLFLLLSLWI